MASLYERLRLRSDRRPSYNIDESDDEPDSGNKKSRTSGPSSDKIEKIERPDVKEGSCQACGEDGDLWSCETCNYAYHPKCLLPVPKGPVPNGWRCPECVGRLSELEKILDSEMRPADANDSNASKKETYQDAMKHYLVKWKGQSYLHCTWVPEAEFVKAYATNPRLNTKVKNFNKQAASADTAEDEHEPIQPEWTHVDRIIACREVEQSREYLVKFKELSYDECYWEQESDIATFHDEIEKFNRIQSRRKEKMVLKEKREDFKKYESSPEFLSGGSLHPYQLDGLNFLCFAWSTKTHVILADEMGLGKTIQSIAYLASLNEETVSPHLVIAPLSTLRNWEREFATWAPNMNVVMYAGNAKARSVIKEHEFFHPKSDKKGKGKKSESKQSRIKFDVLLASYEMINIDSSFLKPIKWECMIVDEGHRLKNKDSKLFSSLKEFSSRHRVLLTGTPLQNNLDELFMLMHFLDAGKFGSLEEFQEEFRDINQEEQISRLHKMLAPHLLRRVKKDVMKELPPKKELILRVELSGKQKEYYRAILARNYEILRRKGGAQISLSNVVMELRKLCCHPFMLEGAEPEDAEEFNKQLLETSGKLQLLDKMLVKLKEQGHRVLIYSQFQHMLDLLEHYCDYREWHYERIDGKVSGAERQIRIDRFNANNSSRFCFLLSTRAGGVGINLASADTVIIYDSDWNPHADLQAMARAHRLGQTNKVMIYRLITRGTVEERMMQLAKRKMVLEHLVVGKLKSQNINQEELDGILRHGSQELFADDNDESVKSRQIHYDDAAIDRLLDREQIGDEEASLDDEEDDEFLKAFKCWNLYIHFSFQVKVKLMIQVANFDYIDKEESAAGEEMPAPHHSEGPSYWEDLLKDKYEEQKMEEFNSMDRRRRSGKQKVSLNEEDFAGSEDESSDAEDDTYEGGLSDDETAAPAPDTPEETPLMEGEGANLRVLGFNRRQRAAFVNIMRRFGPGDYDWADFVPRLKQKTPGEIAKYGKLFLRHVTEDITDSPTYSDGVPKEGLDVDDLLVRIGTVNLIRDKAKAISGGSILFEDDILARYPEIKRGRVWNEHHDRLLLQAVRKHGYGRWQAIAEDKDLQFQQVISQELNFPLLNTPVQGAPKELLRKQAEFIKKRMLLLEKGLQAELQKIFYADDETNEDVALPEETDAKSPSPEAADAETSQKNN
ncbi:Chromodomain-helicase DNA-binding protein [Handroanthus impetiginosus]|uniref:Chromodomain-helicase DNA-binding protein n=1 Tax=Handroanthus impetiginosus TaxID=429701 RepID=A0A2G9HDW0_9LAMI|nr:Chromodomain-helicase DNA-binding protein [Handroanthus impetiginosus]